MASRPISVVEGLVFHGKNQLRSVTEGFGHRRGRFKVRHRRGESETEKGLSFAPEERQFCCGRARLLLRKSSTSIAEELDFYRGRARLLSRKGLTVAEGLDLHRGKGSNFIAEGLEVRRARLD